MTDKLTKCPACDGRGYFRCDCWPGDCICGQDEDTCWECEGDGWIDPTYDDDFRDAVETPDPPPPMTDIPDDLKAIGIYVWLETISDDTPDAWNIIAAAILAERKRCENIADDEASSSIDGEFWMAQRIRDRISDPSEGYDPFPRRTEDGCLSHLPQGGGTDSPVTQNQPLPQGYQGGRAMTDTNQKEWTQADAERENKAFHGWWKERGYDSYPDVYSLTCQNAMHAAWQEAAERTTASLKEIREENDRLKGELEKAETERDHFYALSVDDPGKNPPEFWKDRSARVDERAAASEASCKALKGELEAIREAWMDGDTTGAYIGTEGSKRLPLKTNALASCEAMAKALESAKTWVEPKNRWHEENALACRELIDAALDAYRKEKGEQ